MIIYLKNNNFVQNYFYFDQQKLQLLLNLKVKAGAKFDKIEGFILLKDKYYLKIMVKQAPEQGKANKAIIKMLAKNFRISQTDLEITTGHSTNYKTIIIKNITQESLKLILDPYINAIPETQ